MIHLHSISSTNCKTYLNYLHIRVLQTNKKKKILITKTVTFKRYFFYRYFQIINFCFTYNTGLLLLQVETLNPPFNFERDALRRASIYNNVQSNFNNYKSVVGSRFQIRNTFGNYSTFNAISLKYT